MGSDARFARGGRARAPVRGADAARDDAGGRRVHVRRRRADVHLELRRPYRHHRLSVQRVAGVVPTCRSLEPTCASRCVSGSGGEGAISGWSRRPTGCAAPRTCWHAPCMTHCAMSRAFQIGLRALVLVPAGILIAACGDAEPTTPPLPPAGSHDFISHVPNGSAGNANDGAESADGGLTGAPAPGQDAAGGDGEEERLISEADSIKVDGTKLYALSRYSGLSVIDVADPANLNLLGSHKTSAIPFEMYVEGERAYVMYNGWGRYEVDDTTGYWSWQSTSRIEALDVD